MADKSKGYMYSCVMPKGDACALHLTPEYRHGRVAGMNSWSYTNPYDFFDDYEKHYAWDIGYQKGKKEK